MITRVRIKNFQLVRDLDIRFDKVTAIIGESEKGKSCIFRSIQALVSNSRGNKFITRGESFCEVEVWTERGSVTWHKKSAGSAKYTVTLPDGKVELYERVEEVPRQAREVLGINPVEFGDDTKLNVSMAGQFDDPFLIFETGTTVAKVLGKFTRLDEIYAAVRTANKDLLGVKADEKHYRIDLEDAKKRLEGHGEIPNLEPVLAMMERSVSSLSAKQKALDGLQKGLGEARAAQGKVEALKGIGVVGKLTGWPPSELRSKIDQMDKWAKDVQVIKVAKARIATYVDKVEWQAELVQKAMDALEAFKEANNLCPACGRAWA